MGGGVGVGWGVHIRSIVDEGIRTNFKPLCFFFYKKISHPQKAQKAYKQIKTKKTKTSKRRKVAYSTFCAFMFFLLFILFMRIKNI